MQSWGCWDCWIACIYDGKIVLLLFRVPTWAKRNTQQLFWTPWQITIYSSGTQCLGLLAVAMTSISWMPVPYTSALSLELTLALILIMLLAMIVCFKPNYLVDGIPPSFSFW